MDRRKAWGIAGNYYMETLFYRNKYLLWLTVLILFTAGGSALLNLPRLEDPRITNRNPIIITAFPGATSERVETLVTEKIEEELKEVPEIKEMISNSRTGVSVISLELVDSVDENSNEEVFGKIRDKLADAERLLPPGSQRPDFDDKRGPVAFTLIMGLVWDHQSPPQVGILKRLAKDLADRLRNVPGTEIVRLYGEPTEEITVSIDREETAALGWNVSAIARLIGSADAKVPAGVLRGQRSEILLEVTGELDSLTRIADVPLRSGPRGEAVRLGDIAQLSRDWRDPPTEISLVDGRRAVLVAARMKADMRTDRWARDARVVVNDFQDEVGKGITLVEVFDQSTYTNYRLRELGLNLLAGAGVIVVAIFFVMGLRSSILIGAALPLTASLTLFIVLLAGGEFHQLSIFGMIIALGLLIDSAIVVVDEVQKRLAEGMQPLNAVRETFRFLFAPLFAATMTTVLAFAPIMLLPGNVGDFVSWIGGSVIAALTSSFLVAMTLVLSLAGRYGRARRSDAGGSWWRDGFSNGRLTSVYRRGLLLSLRYPLVSITLAFALPVAGFILSRTLGSEFFPPVDRNMFEMEVRLPTESSIRNSRATAEAIEAVVRKRSEVANVHWLIGGSFPSVFYNLVMNRDNAPNYAHAIVTAGTAPEVKRLVPSLQQELDRVFPGAQIVAGKFGQGPPVAADVEFYLYGPGIRKLQDMGERVRLVLQSHPEVLHTRMTMPRGEPKLWLDANEDESNIAGLSLVDVADQLRSGLEGVTGGSVLENLEEMPVRIRYADATRTDLTAVGSTNLVSDSAVSWIPLNALGELKLRPEPGGITRRDGIRANTIEGFTREGALPIDVTNDVVAALDEKGFEVPPGYRMEIGGTAKEENEAMGLLLTYAPVLVTVMIATVILAFRSVTIAAMLGVVAAMSVGLGLLSTWSMSFPVSFNTILGTLGLMGVALNDSIVVLAAIRSNPAARTGDHTAIVKEIMGTTRHLVATTLTTAAGFLPLLIFVGGDFWPPLAIVLAGGVVGATILAIAFIPQAYETLVRRKLIPYDDEPAVV